MRNSRIPESNGSDPKPLLASRVLRGVVWSTAEQIGGRAVSFVVLAVLARLLVPEDFGLLALAMVVISFGERLAEQGLSEMIIREPELKPGFLESAFLVNLLGSGLLAGITIGASWSLARLLKDPAVQPLLITLSLTFLFIGGSAVPMALLQRRMQFRSLARCSLTGSVLGGVTGVVLAASGAGVWSLVFLQLVASGTSALLYWRAAAWMPATWPGTRFFKSQLRFGASILGIRTGNFLNRRSDDLFIGVFLGTVALGYYAIAYKVYWTLSLFVLGSLKRVAFPAFSKIIASREELGDRYRQAVTMTVLAAFPAFAGIALTADTVIPLLFGTGWGPSARVLMVVAPVGLLHAVVYYVDPILVALGRVRLLLRLEIASGILNAAAFAAAAQVNLMAVAWAFAAVNTLLFPVRIEILRRVTGIGPRVYAGPVFRALGMTLFMGAGVLGTSALLRGSVALPVLLLAEVAAGALLYGGGWTVLATLLPAWRHDLEPLRTAIRVS